MTDEVGPWLFRLEFEVIGWNPPEKLSEEQQKSLNRLLASASREVELAKVKIFSHTFSIPGTEGRYIDVFQLISGRLRKDLEATSQKINRHLREVRVAWEEAANLLNTAYGEVLLPPNVELLSKHYIFSCGFSSDNEKIALPSYIDAARLKMKL